MTLKELVKYIVGYLVDNPDKIEIIENEGKQTTVIELKVAPSDLGKVIGKNGRTIKAVRTIVSIAALKMGKKAIIEILED